VMGLGSVWTMHLVALELLPLSQKTLDKIRVLFVGYSSRVRAGPVPRPPVPWLCARLAVRGHPNLLQADGVWPMLLEHFLELPPLRLVLGALKSGSGADINRP